MSLVTDIIKAVLASQLLGAALMLLVDVREF